MVFCVSKFQKNGRICGFHWTFRSKKCFSFRGALPPWPPDQGLCLWTPLGALPLDPRYRLALHALAMPPPLPNPKYATGSSGSSSSSSSSLLLHSKTFSYTCRCILPLSLSLIPGQGAGHSSKKSHRRRGSVLTFPPGQMSCQAWSWAGHCSTRCSAVSSALLQCGQVAESRRPIWCRYPASNGEWSVYSWATVTHWSLVQSRCQRWNWLTLAASTRWILACGSLRYLSSATLCWCRLTAMQAKIKSIGLW